MNNETITNNQTTIEEQHNCEYCGAVITSEMLENDEAGIVYNSEYVCRECLDERFIYSEEEDEYIDRDDAVEVRRYNGDTFYVSSEYAINNYYHDIDDYYDYYFEDDGSGCYTAYGDWICEDNYMDNYFTCDDCGDIYRNDYINMIEGDENYYCENCYNARIERGEGLIYDYHHYSDWHKTALEGEQPSYYIGFELEIDNDCDQPISEVHELITSNIPSVLMHDGSLSHRGIEIVTQPLSYEYIKAHESEFKKVYNTLSEKYNYTSHNNGRCGLHFHFTRPSDEAVDRCILIIENFKDEIYTFSRRENLRWCQFISERVDAKRVDDVKSIEYISKHKNNFDRYMALNNTNRNTIEFRMMRGTLNYDTFRASVDLLNTIYNIACDTSIDLTTISWQDLVNMSGSYCKTYCINRGIQSTAKIVDNSDIIRERAKRVEEYKIKIDKLFKDYSNYAVKRYNSKVQSVSIENIANASIMLSNLRDDIASLKNWLRYDYQGNPDALLYDARNQGWRIVGKWYQSRYNNLIKEVTRLCV